MLRILFVLSTLLLSLLSVAAPIPEALQDWQDWVLREHKDIACPRVAAQKKDQRYCAWPGPLNIEADQRGARFSQRWQVYGESWVALPGDARHWPWEVRMDGRAATVVSKQNKPYLLLAPGQYVVSGQINWQRMPQFLSVSPVTALLQLKLNGRVTSANLSSDGKLWLEQNQRTTATETKGDTVKLEVFRRLTDQLPMQLMTELRLAVSGTPRELLLGQLLPDNTEVMSFSSPLPARIEADGRLRIQARPGQWVVRVNARYLSNPDSFAMQRLNADWPDQEVWSFKAEPSLRGVKLGGIPAVDPSQIDLPADFAQLPTYLMTAKDKLTLEEQYRGDAAPAANKLKLLRTLWLDFDGEGATVKDQITGAMTHGWRLQVDDSMALGSARVNGAPQLVTRLADQASAGVEIRHSQVDLEAVSRLAAGAEFSASGWQQDVNDLRWTLNLPPGWQLWHVSGPDRVTRSWLSRWDLWDVFLCLLIVGGVARLLSWRWAVVAALTLALTFHVSGAPLVSWLIMMVTLPLLRVLPQSGFRKLVSAVAVLTVLVVTLIGLQFAVTQVRQALYPQLELRQTINHAARVYPAVTAQDVESKLDFYDAQEELSSLSRAPRKLAGKVYGSQKNKARYQQQLNVQTGPGVPTWQWRRVNLSWSGPVRAGERVQLYLSPPWLSRILYVVQVVLVALLIFALGRALLQQLKLPPSQKEEGAAPAAPIASAVLAAVLLGSAALPEPSYADMPSEALLKQLQAELTRAPACKPDCLAVQQVDINADKNRLSLDMRLTTHTELAVPVPSASTWQLDAVMVNARDAMLASYDGQRWLRLGAGAHRINLSGAIKADQLTLDFPVQPHNISVLAPQWDVEGLVQGSLSGRALQLIRRQQKQQQNTLLPDPVQPFVTLERRLDIDLDWMLVTRIQRMAPASGAINLRIPLLAGESVVSREVTVEDGHVLVTLDGRQQQYQWQSVLPPVPELTLTAASSDSWSEVWQLNSSERWHITTAGLNPIKAAGQVWKPRAGESLSLKAVQPESVDGATTTVESAQAIYRPGARSAELELKLSVRTSLGGDYPIKLLEAGQLQKITIDGVEQTRPKDDDAVIVSLRPGLQQVSVQWELPEGVASYTDIPQFELPTSANNIELQLNLPRSRWPLYVGGPNIGPAMLYWGVLVVICLVALGLGRIVKRQQLSIPVNSLHWLLLAIGISTVSLAVSLPVVAWFFVLEARRHLNLEPRWHNLLQLGLVLLTLIAVVSLCVTIPQSLLSTPDMQVTGNGSSNYFYSWYQDRSAHLLPTGWVWSLPLWVYRVVMLLWSLWLVFALLRWARWGWQCFNQGALWKRDPKP